MVILCDLDGTLINKHYKLTIADHLISDAIQLAQDKGNSVGLISDTPSATLTSWYQRLGMGGPICSENGALIEWPYRKNPPHFIDLADSYAAAALRDGFLLELVGHNGEGWNVVVGDVNRFADSPDSVCETDRPAILVNGMRKYSLSFFVRTPQGSEQQVTLCQYVMGLASRVISRLSEERSWYSRYWSCGFDTQACFVSYLPRMLEGKRTAVKEVLTRRPRQRVAIIGNSLADFVNLPRVTQVAVDNADYIYKHEASFVAPNPHTLGVVEALQWLSERS